ncbi:MAG: hypothetical protein K1X79_09390, partial [Oligoflexia bacterium]|nr:hypothetical protein [Oligoflexia bacterium]
MSAVSTQAFSQVPVLAAGAIPENFQVRYNEGSACFLGNHVQVEVFHAPGAPREVTKILLQRFPNENSSPQIDLVMEAPSGMTLAVAQQTIVDAAVRRCFFDLAGGVDALIRAGEELGFRSGFVLGGAEHGQAVPVDSAGYRETLLTSIIPPIFDIKDIINGAATNYPTRSE